MTSPNLNSLPSLVAQAVKSICLQYLGWEDLLEKEMAPHSSTLAWKIPWMEEPGRLQSMGSQRVGHDRVTSLSRSYICQAHRSKRGSSRKMECLASCL